MCAGSPVEDVEKQRISKNQSPLSEVIKSVGINFVPAVLIGDKKIILPR